jgi:hypothetical protein
VARPTNDDRVFARRYRRNKKRGRAPNSVVGLRMRDLETFFNDRYGPALPDDDAGRDELFIAANTLCWYADDPAPRIRAWAAQRAPWMREHDLDDMIDRIIARPLRWTADKLAQRLGLTDADRARLAISTIGSIDVSREQRLARRQEQQRIAKEIKRRLAGATPQDKLRARSAAHRKPWLALGISERTWYRRAARGRSASAA